MKVLEREFANLETFDPAKILDSVVDAYIVYLDAHPDFRTISFGRYISAATKEREASPNVGLPALLKNFMLRAVGDFQHARARPDAAHRERDRRAPHRLRLRTAHPRKAQPHHRRNEKNVGRIFVRGLICCIQRTREHEEMKLIRPLLQMGLGLILAATSMFGQNVGNCTAKDSSTRPDCPGAIAFFQKLQAAVKAGQRPEVAAMIQYPVTIFVHGKQAGIAESRGVPESL